MKPYVKRSKTDAADAEAICEAVTRPTMRFVAVRTAENQAVLLQHRSRKLLVKQRTMLVNAVRGHMAEFGIVAPQGLPHVVRLKLLLAEHAGREIPVLASEMLEMLFDQIDTLNKKIENLQNRIMREYRTNKTSQRLTSIPGVGPLTASAIVATVGDMGTFGSGREFAVWLGLTPQEHSSGNKRRIGAITKRGD